MKHFFVVAGTLLYSFSYSQTTSSSPYCNGQFDDPASSSTHAIARVKLETLDNNTGNTPSVFPHYVYYNNLPPVDLVRGQTYTLTLVQSPVVTLTHGMAAWIDFDGDNIFDPSADSIAASTIDELNVGTNEFTYTFTVPMNAQVGETRMRVKIFEDDQYTWILGYTVTPPCQYPGGILDWGETEDYKINITTNAALESAAESPFKILRSEDMLRIEGELPQTVQLFSMDGKMIPVTDTEYIDLSSLPAGLYILKIQSQQGNWFEEKIVK